jgi:uncharacterized protein YbjT (DUF2867 family)
MDQGLVLVAGASGYIAGRLVPKLLSAGFRVRCMARDPRSLRGRSWFPSVETVAADVTRPESLPAAMRGVSAAYYLVHSMAAGAGYARLDVESARTFAGAARAAGTAQLVYLGGLADETAALAPHLKSRIDTGRALREPGVPVTEFRTGVIVGPGSVSFEMLRFIVEQSPLIVGPRWLRRATQPIAIDDVVSYLAAAIATPACRGRVVEIGGSDRMSYADAMLAYARARGLRRRVLLLPVHPVRLMAARIARITPVGADYALPLVGGLRNDSFVRDPAAGALFPGIRPRGYVEALRIALDALHPDAIDRPWLDGDGDAAVLRHQGFLVDFRRIEAARSPATVHSEGVFGPWQPDAARDGMVRSRAERRWGTAWLELAQAPRGALEATLFLAPRGLPGFLWWHALRRGHARLARSLLVRKY